jgi:hypothetical protein
MGVVHILRTRRPLKVLNRIVTYCAVLVVYFCLILGIRNKGLGNKPVDSQMTVFPVPEESNA